MSCAEKVPSVAVRITRLYWENVAQINCRAALLKRKVVLT